ncbi:MAG: hypothetical protein GF308_04905 [Candidatus Heimdallarchaeota archaeon]|nr:hypothetical protein [Candidatus Heimdallarchaeota archaeon]
MAQICCLCGKSEEEEPIIDGFCLSCYAKEFPLIHSLPESSLKITVCKNCQDLKYKNEWIESTPDSKVVILQFLEEFFSQAKKVKGTEIIHIKDFFVPSLTSASKQEMTIIVEGTPKKEVPPYRETIEIPLIINVGVCTRCAQYTRGYFESIIQIRAEDRSITPMEQIEISALIEEKTYEELETNRMAYISKTVDQQRGGLDLYVGSDSFAKSLADFLATQLAASLEIARKLQSHKDGKALYRTTYCVRLPAFQIGDIILYQKDFYQILDIALGRVVLFDLKNQKTKTLSQKESRPETITVVQKKDQLKQFIILAIQPPNVSLMNAETFETIDIDQAYVLKEHQEGDEIQMVDLPEGLFECQFI